MAKDTIVSQYHPRNRLANIKLIHMPQLSLGSKEFNIIHPVAFVRLNNLIEWTS